MTLLSTFKNYNLFAFYLFIFFLKETKVNNRKPQ